MLHALQQAAMMTLSMGWEILWALALGFFLSAVVQAVVSKEEMGRLLPDDSPRTIAVACGLGAASSSCSYAATALARSLFRKGANFTASIAFQFASTNLVIELGVLLALVLGWQFTLAEFVGGPLMIAILVLLFKAFLTPRMVEAARRQAEKGIAGHMEGHAAMDMSIHRDAHRGTLWRRAIAEEGRTAISHFFFMDWYSLWLDILVGVVIASCISVWVPKEFWQALFLQGHPVLARLWGPLIGVAVSILSFVCSIGNVPLAAVLWQGGISFGGVIAFLFADLLILPLLNIYRRYYGLRVTSFLFSTFYLAMAAAALGIEYIFRVLHLIPQERTTRIVEESIRWNYTTWLNLVFLALAAVMLVRFLRTGGPAMLRAMGEPSGSEPPKEDGAKHHCCH